MDFGRVSLDEELILYLFGTPGQHRFWFMWDELVHGAIGAVVLVDTRRLADCFPAVDFFEDRKLPYILAINCFDGIQRHQVEDVREAMSFSLGIPIVTCDARQRESTKQTLISLVEYVVRLRTLTTAPPTTAAR
jgi:signal recognition particle receptor subunit beta